LVIRHSNEFRISDSLETTVMDRALLLLMWLRWQGWLRRHARNLGTVKGLVIFALSLFVIGSCLVSYVFERSPTPNDPETVRRIGTLALLAFCLMNLIFSSFERAIYFPPAEVNFLFPGPFARRHLVAYKIASNFMTYLFSALVMTFFLRQSWSWFVAAYVGLILALVFLQLFSMVAALVVTKVGAQAFNQQRKLLLLTLLALVAASLLPLGRQLLTSSAAELLEQVEQSAVIQTVLAPFRWFVEAFTSQYLWPDLVHWSVLGLAINGGLLLLVFALLDARYLEAVAAASERITARIQLMRSGLGSITPRRGGKVRLTLPSLPWWGGLGPIAWRQLLTASRNWGRLILLVFYFACMMIPMVVSAKGATVPLAPGLAILIFGVTVLLAPMVTFFDFRGDVDRMDILKSLPIRDSWLAMGQAVAPVVLFSLIQWSVLGLVQIVTWHLEPFLLAAAVFVLPFNFLLFALENLLFLWFPTRIAPWTPGDFQQFGRNLLFLLGRFTCLGLALGTAAIAGVLAHLLTGGSLLAGLIASWLVLAAYASGMIPLMALAFRHYDVARDTPP
jgi:hypothetical protein